MAMSKSVLSVSGDCQLWLLLLGLLLVQQQYKSNNNAIEPPPPTTTAIMMTAVVEIPASAGGAFTHVKKSTEGRKPGAHAPVAGLRPKALQLMTLQLTAQTQSRTLEGLGEPTKLAQQLPHLLFIEQFCRRML